MQRNSADEVVVPLLCRGDLLRVWQCGPRFEQLVDLFSHCCQRGAVSETVIEVREATLEPQGVNILIVACSVSAA